MKTYRIILLVIFLIVGYFLYNRILKKDVLNYDYSNKQSIVELNNKLLKVNSKDKYGIIKITGEVLLPLEFDELEIENDGKIIAKIKDKYGVMTLENKKYLEFIYDSLEEINSKYYKAKKDNSVFLIEKKNKKNIKFEEALDIKYFNKNYFVIKKDHIESFDENLDNKKIYIGDDVHPLNKKIFLLKTKEKYYLISGDKKILYSENIEQIYNEYLVINENNKRIIKKIDEDKPILNGYDTIYINGDDSIIVQKNGKYGVVNIKNETQIYCKYDKISPLYQGYYAVELDFKCGLINKKDKIVLPLEYEAITNFNRYFALTCTEEGEEIVFLKRKKIILPYYDEVIFFDNDKIVIKTKENMEFYNKKGEKILILNQNEIKIFGKNYIITDKKIIKF